MGATVGEHFNAVSRIVTTKLKIISTASSFHDIVDRKFLDFPVRIKALRNSICLPGSDAELSQDAKISQQLGFSRRKQSAPRCLHRDVP